MPNKEMIPKDLREGLSQRKKAVYLVAKGKFAHHVNKSKDIYT